MTFLTTLARSLRHELATTLSAPDSPAGPTFADGLMEARPVLVYGTGECSHWFHEIAMKIHGCRPMAVLDRMSRPGDYWHGIPAFQPESYQPSPEVLANALVVVCVGDPRVFAEIAAYLRHRNFRHIRWIADIYEIHNPFAAPVGGYERGVDFYRESEQAIFSAFDLLADNESREVFVRYLQTHVTRRPRQIPRRPRDEQYFPSDITLAHGHRRYVCCGAYDGDTLRLLQQKQGKVDAVACFEPEPHIFERLQEFLRDHGNVVANEILTWPCAVDGENGQRSFLRGDGLGSRICAEGEHIAQCVTLDSALPQFTPTFISMDVEGAEPEVLRGAERILRKHVPDLGICVYHSPNHIWEIPLYLARLDLGYRLYLRNYTGFAIETVLYASR